MSTTRSPVIRYKDEDWSSKAAWGEERTYEGRLDFSHTSDTVAWVVDGKQRWVMSNAEFGAMLETYEALKKEQT